MTSIEQLIQNKAYELGYEKCGIISINRLDGFEEKLKERISKVEGTEGFYQGQKRLISPQNEYPWAKSVVVLTVAYSGYEVMKEVEGHIGKSYLFDIRVDKETEEFKNRQRLERYMKELGLQIAANHKFGIVPMRWAALQAGLGIVRRNNFFYTESGSWVHLEAWLTDREMELTEEAKLIPCPSGCNRCIKGCPTASLSEPYTMNPLKCISFLTSFGGRDLPNEPLATKFEECIYGCDICQDVCPMNHKKWVGNKSFPGLSELVPHLSAEGILAQEEYFYKDKIQPKLFYLTSQELWKLQVNALNYLANHYKESYRPLIKKACESKYEKVREMAESVCKKIFL